MNAHDEFIQFLVEHIPAERLIALKASTKVRQRVWCLIAKEKDRGFTDREKCELDDFMWPEHLLILAKAKALSRQKGI